MKTASKIIALAFVLMMIATPLLAVEDLSASGEKINRDVKVTRGFDDMNGGTIEVTINECTVGNTYVLKATQENKTSVWSETKFTASDATSVVTLSWNFGSSGDKTILVILYDETGTGEPLAIDGGIRISVSHSIWKDWTTYAAIVIVVLLIIVAVYLKMRGLPGSAAKKKKTFSEMEAEKASKASTEKKSFFSKDKEAPATIEQPQAPSGDTTSTEKQTYTPGRGFFKKRNQ